MTQRIMLTVSDGVNEILEDAAKKTQEKEVGISPRIFRAKIK